MFNTQTEKICLLTDADDAELQKMTRYFQKWAHRPNVNQRILQQLCLIMPGVEFLMKIYDGYIIT